MESMKSDSFENFLGPVLQSIVEEYVGFMSNSISDQEGAKFFTARHAAGRSAVGHIAMLAKLIRWSSLPNDRPVRNGEEDLSSILSDARNELSRFNDDD